MKRLATALVTAVLLTTAAAAQPRKLSPDLLSSTSSQVRVLVRWNQPIGGAVQALLTQVGAQTLSQFTALNQGLYSVPASSLSLLESSPLVQYVTLDRTLHRKLALAAAAINAPSAWRSGFQGKGIGVAILDSGVNPDSNLGLVPRNTIVYSQDFTVSLSSTVTPATMAVPGYGLDWYGHGQHIAGIIASNGVESTCTNCTSQMVGIAPAASLIDFKVLDEFGSGSDSQVIAAINQAILLKSVYNIRVINLSLGRGVYESYQLDPLCQAVEAAWKAGITVVVAAGNEGRDNSNGNQGYGTITAPGNDPYVITVGSMKTEGTPNRTDDLIASYSSKGPTFIDHVVKPDIVAPGNQVISLMAMNGTMPLTVPQNAVPLATYQTTAQPVNAPVAQAPVPNNPNQVPPAVNYGSGWSRKYYSLSGTSMAAAVVSGALADLFQAYPALTPDQAKMLLMTTSYQSFPTSSSVTDPASGVTYTDYYDVFTVGAGYLDLQAALAAAPQVLVSTGTALSPIASLDSLGNLVLTPDPTSIWNSVTLMGSRAVWVTSGDDASRSVWSTSTVDGSRSVWSTSSDSANRSVWTTSSDSSESTAIGEP